MRLLFQLLLVGFLTLWGPKSYGQDLAYWQLTEEDGLPGMSIYKILQDPRGYIWICSSNGISKYNGEEFTTYNDRSLKDKEILFADSDQFDNIWFLNLSQQIGTITPDGLQLLDTKDVLPQFLPFNFLILEDYLYLFGYFTDGDLKNKVGIARCHYDEAGKITDAFIFDFSLKLLDGLLKTENLITFSGRLTGTNSPSDLFVVSNQMKNIQKSDIYHTYAFSKVRPAYVLDQDFYYLSNRYTELWQFNSTKNELLQNFTNQGGLNTLEKVDNKFYCLTQTGFCIQDLNFSNKEPAFYLSQLNCQSILEDQEGNIWIGTANSGIYIFPQNQIKAFNANHFSTSSSTVSCIAKSPDGNKILMGLEKGTLGIIDVATKKTRSIDLNIKGNIVELYFDQKGDLWISADKESIILDPKNYQILNSEIPIYKTVIQTKKGDFVFGTHGQTYLLPEKTVKGNKGLIGSIFLTELRTYALFEDLQQTLWIGTTKGIYTQIQDTVVPFLEKDLHVAYNVADILQSQDYSIWVATLGDGLLQIKNGIIVDRINLASGLISNTCKHLFLDKNNLWISTDKGLNVIDLSTKKIKLINKTDGLPSNDINETLVVNEEVWVATNKGLINFPAGLNHQNNFPPPIHLTHFKIWEQDTLIKDNLELAYDQNNFFIGFQGLAYRARGNISYEYKLLGVDKNWVSSHSNFVRYPALEPGEYKFEVLAVNEDGAKSTRPATITFNISPPWWKTWWFRASIFLLILGSIYTFFQWRLNNIQEREAKEQEFKDKVNNLKQHALQTQMNPHFVFNALNAIQQFLLTNSQEEAMTYLSRFARMVRLIFEHSKQQKIEFDQEIEFLNLYLQLEKLRFKDKVNIMLSIAPNLKNSTIDVQVPPLLLQPLIENSFKHGLFHKKGPGTLKIDFQKTDHYLQCTIEDNGVGRAKASELSSWKGTKYESSGLKTAQERLMIINDRTNTEANTDLQIIDLFDDAENPTGTKVIVQIKI